MYPIAQRLLLYLIYTAAPDVIQFIKDSCPACVEDDQEITNQIGVLRRLPAKEEGIDRCFFCIY